MTRKIYDITIVGAGAGGLMLASLVKDRSVCIIDANPDMGAKIKVSGGGKCNVTNEHMNSSHFDGDKTFVDAVLKRFSSSKLLEYFKKNKLQPKLQPKLQESSVAGQYFFKSSSELLDFFGKSTRDADFLMNTKVLSVEKEEFFEVTIDRGIIKSKQLIIASGGLSYPLLGASSIGYDVAAYFGHEIVTTKPALVGFTVQKEQFWMKELSGVSTPVVITVKDRQIKGDMLFAHKGCSGPAVLSASLYWDKGLVEVDFVPSLEFDREFLSSQKQLTSLLPLPKNLSKALLDSLEIIDKQAKTLTKNDIEKLGLLKSYKFAPAGTFGYQKAEVTKGGVSVAQIDANSMQSGLQEGLFFLGEVLDVTGELGGYNIHWAFATATVCANFLQANSAKK